MNNPKYVELTRREHEGINRDGDCMAFKQSLIGYLLGGKMEVFNTYLDKLARPEVRVFHRSCSAFQFCGCIGLVLSTLLAVTLTLHLELSPSVTALIILTSMLTFLALVMATKIITGEERIIYYHHEITVTVALAIVLRLARQPLLPYLDITILSIGTFLAFGRIGCLLVGCCHGRPCCWGVRYREEHAAAGFPSYFVGVRLLPIQAVESAWVLCTVAVGTHFVWIGSAPGTALAWYVVVYDFGRFCFEFARGDADRPYWLGFSQPQWISLALTAAIVGAELAGSLPFVRWHLVVFGLLVATMAVVAIKRRSQATPVFQLLHPKHIRQIASAMSAVCTASDRPPTFEENQLVVVSIATTSLGIRISGSHTRKGNECSHYYTLSSERDAMTERMARVLAKLVRSLTEGTAPERLIAGPSGVFHVVISSPMVAES